jgi:hypothetical protein
MIELLPPYGFDTMEYSWVKATIGICTHADYSVDKKCQQAFWRHCRGSQLILSICRVNKKHLVNTIILCRIIFCSILFVILTEMCVDVSYAAPQVHRIVGLSFALLC